jgi:branched-chain amino acid transport system substrate-binding protein
MSLRKTLLTLALLALPCLAAAERTVKLAVVLPDDATPTARTLDTLAGLKLALEEVNQRGGVLPGTKVELLHVRQASDAEAATLAARLAADPEVACVIGHPDGASSLAAMPVYAEADLPVLQLWAADMALTRRDWRNIFRLCPNDEDQGQEAALFTLKTLRKKKVVLVTDGSERGRVEAGKFKEALRGKGVREQAFLELTEPLPEDLAPLGAKLRGYGPNLIYYGGGLKAGAVLLRAVKAAKLQVSVMAGDALFSEALIREADDAALGLIVSTPVPSLRKSRMASQRDFLKRFKKANGQGAGLWAAPAYDAGRLVLSALSKAGRPERSALRQALAASDARGLAMPAAFDANGDNLKRRVHFYVVHRNSDSKRIEFVFRMEP